MKKSVDRWVEESGENILKHIGIKRGQKVLDFGCGSGNYTIPAARVVGEQASVYALDEDKEALDRLMSKAKLKGLKNIVRLDASGKSGIALDNESVDVVLVYDILHYYYFPEEDDRRRLLCEVYRVLKPNGLLSVYPTHLESDMEPKMYGVRREIEGANFHEENEYTGMTMVHDDNIEEGRVINFRKKSASVR
jgi:ubiquinone/menaquinone biosynthesis C-methylase UbiE